MIDANDLIREIQDLAPLPASTVRLTQLISDPLFCLSEVSDLITFDQALTLGLLRAANSALSASAEPVCDVGVAVGRMGAAQVLALAVAAGVKSRLRVRLPGYGMDEGALWRHSVAAAVGAEVLPGFCQVEPPAEAFTAALLHDVGKLVMGRFLTPEVGRQIEALEAGDRLSRLEAEVRLLNVHHGQLGARIAEHWKLPPRIVLGILHHHTPERGGDVICDLTYAANHIAKRIEAGLDGRSFESVMDPGVSERLGLTDDALEELWSAAISRYAEVKFRYNAV